MSALVAVATGEHLFWLTSRAAGIVALLASSASVGLGLLMAGRMIKRSPAQLRPLHEALSLATLAAIVIHAGALVFDGYVNLSLADVMVPFLGWATTRRCGRRSASPAAGR